MRRLSDMNRIISTLVLLIVLVATACGSVETTGAESIDGVWQLESGTVNGAPVPLVDGYRITFSGEGSTFGGTAACNQYGATIGIDSGTVTLEELFVTEKACRPEVMDSEAAFLTGLQGVDRAERTDDRLVLSGPDARLEFVELAPIDDQDLIGTTWILESLVDGDAISTTQGDDLTLEFDSDGTFMALTGCRILTGTYVAVGDEIATPTLSADGECTAELQNQDSHVIAVLEGPFTVDIDGDRLTLAAAGNEGLVYRAG